MANVNQPEEKLSQLGNGRFGTVILEEPAHRREQSKVDKAQQDYTYDTLVRVSGRTPASRLRSFNARFQAPSILRCEPVGPIEVGDEIEFSHDDQLLRGFVTRAQGIPAGRQLEMVSYVDTCGTTRTATVISLRHIEVEWNSVLPEPKIGGSYSEESTSQPRVLVLSANPDRDIDLEEEARRIRLSGCEPIYAPAARWEDLVSFVSEDAPQIIHFQGHGNNTEIILRDGRGGAEPARAVALRDFLRDRQVGLVVLASCDSEEIAQLLVEVVETVVGTSSELLDTDAERFSGTFYGQIARGMTVSQALRDATDVLNLSGGHVPFTLLGNGALSF